MLVSFGVPAESAWGPGAYAMGVIKTSLFIDAFSLVSRMFSFSVSVFLFLEARYVIDKVNVPSRLKA